MRLHAFNCLLITSIDDVKREKWVKIQLIILLAHCCMKYSNKRGMENFSDLSSSSPHPPSCMCLPARRVLLFTSVVEWKKKIFFSTLADHLIPNSQYPNCHVWMSYEKCERYVILCIILNLSRYFFFLWILKAHRFSHMYAVKKKNKRNHIIETTSYGSWKIVYFGINFAAVTNKKGKKE